LSKKIVYVDMDDVLCDYASSCRAARLQTPHVAYPQSVAGFFENLVAIDGAIESVEMMLASGYYDPYILTAPSTHNPLSYTEKRLWIERHFGIDFVHRLIICSHKGLLKGDILIDDYQEGRGQEYFEGRLIHFGSAEYPSWYSIQKELKLARQ
jgi:5'-nucleotidase